MSMEGDFNNFNNDNVSERKNFAEMSDDEKDAFIRNASAGELEEYEEYLLKTQNSFRKRPNTWQRADWQTQAINQRRKDLNTTD